jgi:hypothetical protein
MVLKNLTGHKYNVGFVSASRATHSLEMGVSLFAEIIFEAIKFYLHTTTDRIQIYVRTLI